MQLLHDNPAETHTELSSLFPHRIAYRLSILHVLCRPNFGQHDTQVQHC